MEPLLATASKKLPLVFPLFASPKLDGVRAWMPEWLGPGRVSILSRKMKAFPNPEVLEKFNSEDFEGLDGEFTMGNPTAPDVFRATSSTVMSQTASTDGLVFRVFDDIRAGAGVPFHDRLATLHRRVAGLANVSLVDQYLVQSAAELLELEEFWLSEGYEGAMVRSPSGLYKFGRSTEREGILLKVKRFEDCEAVVLDSLEQLHNENPQVEDERGFSKRSSHKENKHGAGILGAFEVRGLNGPYEGVVFRVGSGFDAATRADLWARREALAGKVVKVRYFPSGSKDRPRFPTFVGFRNVEVDG